MRRLWWRWPLLVSIAGLTLASVVGYLLFDDSTADLSRGSTIEAVFQEALAFVPLVWAIPGLIVLRKAGWHPVGWGLALTGLGFCLDFNLSPPVLERVFGIGVPWAAWILDGWGSLASFCGMVVVLSVFPDGIAGGSRRRFLWGWTRVTAALGVMVLAALVTPVGGQEGNSFAEQYRNPTGLGFLPPAVGDVLFLPLILLIAASLVSLWRRSRTADEPTRGQYVWVLSAFGGLFGVLAVVLISTIFVGELGGWVWLPVALMFLVIPVSFSIAMVRNRWFDIDRLVSRTVTFGVVVGISIAVYAIPVLWLPGALGLSSELTVAGATLAAAAIFNPARHWVQRRVDRRFNRARYDAEQIVGSFGSRMQAAADVERVSDELADTAVRALNPALVAVWVVEPAADSTPKR